ncbi:hypothetical protein O3P69_004504 [Scylla paramamosain]|uniref:Ionotropic glutamate receptor C-terminal domain-containing protein n=1 Tax=Scylla paramamosain TaxID=85552 RepID=A0AAW0UCA5_SCYPA
MSFMPFWDEVKIQTPNGTIVTKYEGSDYQLLLAVAAALNFTIRVLPSNSWAEVTSQVEERVSFIASIYYILMTVRAEKYDFTQTYEFSYVSFSMAKPRQEPQWQSLYYPLAHHMNYAGYEVSKGPTLLENVFLDMAGMFLAQSLPHRLPWGSSSRVLMAAWLAFALILGSAYRGNLTAALTLPKYPTRPETIPQLVDAVERITMPPYGDSHYNYYKSSKSPLFNALARLMEVGPNVLVGLQGALQRKRAHLGGRRFLKYQIAEKFTEVDGTSRLYVGRETLYPGASGWPIPHDAPYKPQLDRWITVPLEAGLYEKWAEDLLTKTKLRSQREQRNRQDEQQKQQEGEDGETKESLTALTIIHTQGAFLLLLFGMNIACVAVFVEFVASRVSSMVVAEDLEKRHASQIGAADLPCVRGSPSQDQGRHIRLGINNGEQRCLGLACVTETCFGYTYLPYSPNGARLMKVAIWTPRRGLLLHQNTLPFSEKFANFYGAQVNVTALPFMPYWGNEDIRTPNGTSVIKYEGSDYQLLLAVAAALNFTFRVLPSRSWTEINYVGHKVSKGTTFLESVFLDMAGMFLAQSLPHRLPWGSSSRVLMAAWLAFALILGSAYRGNLTAALTLPKYPTRPETIPQLVDAVERITIPPYGDSHCKYYKSSESPLFKGLAKLLDVGPNVLEGLRGALQHNRAHLGGRRFLKYQIADKFTEVDGTSRLYVGRDTLDPAASGWPIPHDAPYKSQLDRWIMAPVEAGLYEKWVEDLLSETKLRSQREQRNRQIEQKESEDGDTNESLTALTIIHTQGAFLLLLFGINIACVAVFSEFVAARLSLNMHKVSSMVVAEDLEKRDASQIGTADLPCVRGSPSQDQGRHIRLGINNGEQRCLGLACVTETCFVYTYLPYSANGAKLVKVAIWTPRRGLLLHRNTLPFSEKFANFYGAQVDVTALPFMPYWGNEDIRTPNGTSVIKYEGSDYQLLLAVAAALNFTFRVLPSSSWAEINYVGHKVSGGATLLENVFLDMAGMFLAQSLPHRLPEGSSSRILIAAWLAFALILGFAYRGNLTAALTIPKYPPRPETLPQLIDAVERVTMPPYGDSHYNYYKSSKSPLFNALARLMEVGPNVLVGLQGALQHKRAHLGGRRFLKYQIAEKFTEVDGTSRLYVGRETLYPGVAGWPIPHDAPYKPQLDRWITVPLEDLPDDVRINNPSVHSVLSETGFVKCVRVTGAEAPKDGAEHVRLDISHDMLDCANSEFDFNIAGLYEKWAEDLLTKTKLKSQREQRNRQDEQQKQQEGEDGETKESLTALTIIHTQGAFLLLLFGMNIACVAVFVEFVASRLSLNIHK